MSVSNLEADGPSRFTRSGFGLGSEASFVHQGRRGEAGAASPRQIQRDAGPIDEFEATRQLGFIFRVDNCIGCHSCEAACSEKNGLPSHVAWRKVGYLEGGTYPHHTRVNISMACNHCDDPVCLKGCPTGAYVKYQDSGAVVVDSDICFGCRYCTWVCPYEAPAFNPETGSVSKCNMCVDRVDIGLQPACVDACLGHALEFGEIQQYERNHPEALTRIAGFPDPTISKPNVRFEQHRTLPATMTRADTEPIQYQSPASSNGNTACNGERLPYHSVGRTRLACREDEGGIPVREKEPWSSLHSHETSLVIFTLIAQFTVGTFLSLWSVPLVVSGWGGESGWRVPTQAILVGITALLGVGLGISTAHLGKPWRCYRSLNNLRYSWVSREILAMGLFFGGLTVFTILTGSGFSGPWVRWGLGSAVALCGIVSIVTMAKIYMIPARPFWNHPHTWISFYASAFILGPFVVAAVLGLLTPVPVTLLGALIAVAFTTQVIRALSQRRHLQDLLPSPRTNHHRNRPFGPLRTQPEATLYVQGEAGASRDRLFGTFSRFRRMRDRLSALTLSVSAATLAAVVAMALLGEDAPGLTRALSGVVPSVIAFLFITALGGELIGRALFYAVVTPTSMPGSLFLQNRGFEQMARNTGLAKDRMVGVSPH